MAVAGLSAAGEMRLSVPGDVSPLARPTPVLTPRGSTAPSGM
ncbi:hypothetical protein AB0D71_17415 [Streptomyces avermitilis]